MPLWKEYHVASSIQDALSALTGSQGDSCIISGGTDLLLDMQQRRHPAVHTLVDVTQIKEMTALEVQGEHIFIGAAVPLNQIISSELIDIHAQALGEACSLIGGPQVRNVATLGGNVGHALPAADGTIALLALGADVQIASPDGTRNIGLEKFFMAPGKSCLNTQKEFVVGFRIPVIKPDSASAFQRVMRPQGVAIAILNMGIWLERVGDKIGNVSIAVGPSGPVPKRAEATEDYLQGKRIKPENIASAIEVLKSESTFRTSPHRSSADYRHHLCGVLFKKVLLCAWMRTKPV